ncbi:hypothetical protein BsIDN1_09200 [Bacillus safensis]|uniref:Alanine racemase C-terminal domain-containing protein n=1 Tax=Bacillus safensis TaxID=561879 RepID=A0A5S9M3H7_BACIA|nr:hypothetical protein BsIDN1_09200 [Bacillus safensis]
MIGGQGEEMVSVDEIAKRLETINYEVTCSIGHRVPRVYIEDGKGCMCGIRCFKAGQAFSKQLTQERSSN